MSLAKHGIVVGCLSLGLWLLVHLETPGQAQSGLIPAALVTSSVYDGVTPLLPKFAIVDGATSGDNTIVAAVSGKKIRVLAGSLTMTGTAVTIRFESGAGGTALTGQMQPAAGQTIALPFSPVGHFETAAATLLNMELSDGQSVDGWIVYVEI